MIIKKTHTELLDILKNNSKIIYKLKENPNSKWCRICGEFLDFPSRDIGLVLEGRKKKKISTKTFQIR